MNAVRVCVGMGGTACSRGTSYVPLETSVYALQDQGRLTDTIRCVSVERDVILGRWVHVPAITVFSCDIFLMFRCSWCMYVIVLDD